MLRLPLCSFIQRNELEKEYIYVDITYITWKTCASSHT